MTLRFSFEHSIANQKCRRCGAVFTPGPEHPVLMDMCPECHSRKIRRANTLLMDRLAEIMPCGLCGHCEKVHRYKCTRFLDVCTIPGCGCQNFVARNVAEYEPEPWIDGVRLESSISSGFTSRASEAGAIEVITNKDIVAMVGAGMDEQSVIAKIKTSPIRFAFSAEELIKLKKSRVSDAIIETMLKTQGCGSR
jgi:hypothetical protein